MSLDVMTSRSSRAKADLRAGPVGRLLHSRGRWHWIELLLPCVMAASFWLAPDHTLLLTQIWIAAILGLSLELLQGYGGMPSMGQAAYFGLGAYAAALFGQAGVADPLAVLALSLAVGAAAGLLSGLFLARLTGLAFLMLTLSFGLILQQVAMRWSSVTGGENGLYSFVAAPLLGRFEFDLGGITAFWYTLAVLLLVLFLIRRFVASPFGIRTEAVRENPQRAASLGISVPTTRLVAIVISAAIAAVAGCLLTQTTGIVSVETLGIDRSVMALIILALGGQRTLYGAIAGAAIFIAARDVLAASDPVYWYFWLGVVIVLIAVFLPEGLVGKLIKLFSRKEDVHGRAA